MSAEERQQIFRRKSIKYIVLSVILSVMLFVSTGCSALLLGDNKKAYDLMVKAADYFKHPSSVQIASGEISGNGLYCVIRATNSFGKYRSDYYYVSSSGYPKETYDSKCRSQKLNYDLINNALAAHFGKSSSSFSANLMGGINMSSDGLTFLYIVLLIMFLCVHGYLASNASDMAEEKGFEKRKWFHICFWLGPIGFIIIASMPDRVMRNNQSQTNELLGELIKVCNTAPGVQEHNASDDISSYLPDL